MNKKPSLRLNRNVYLIILCILLLAGAVQVTNSEYFLQFNRNDEMTKEMKDWRPQAADQAALQRTGSPYCTVYDPNDPNRYYERIHANVRRVLDYMKMPIKESTAEELQTDGCAAVILSSSKLEPFNPAALARYVEDGGYVFITTTPELDDAFYQLYRKMGILNVGGYGTEHSIELTSNVLIGEQGLAIDGDFIQNLSLRVELEAESRVLAKSAEGIPLLWDHAYGQGKFMVFNGTMLQEKTNRGLISGALSMLEPEFIYPIFNSKLLYIDYFPAPIANTFDPALFEAYNRDRVRFFKDIWWPDMLKAAKKYDAEYTAVLMQSYNDKVSPPFNDPIDEDLSGLISYGREVIKSGGEIGLHGFNHQSLVSDRAAADKYGMSAWSNRGYMELAIAESLDFAKQAFPGYRLLSYVPPSHALSPEGREALKKAWPDMAIIASQYAEDASGFSYVQEYEIASDGILELPRITSGYDDLLFMRWAGANALTSLGIFSHVVQPNDVLKAGDSDNQSWESKYDSFTTMLKRLDDTYPWLRPQTSAEAGIEVEKALSRAVDWQREDGLLTGAISPFEGEAYYILRTDKKILSATNCTVDLIDEGTYIVKAVKANFIIRLGG